MYENIQKNTFFKIRLKLYVVIQDGKNLKYYKGINSFLNNEWSIIKRITLYI